MTDAMLSQAGYAVIPRAFDPALATPVAGEIARLHAGYAELKGRFPELRWMGEWTVRSPEAASDAIRDFIYSEFNRGLALELVGPDADLYWCITGAKPPLRGKAFPWHQDEGYGDGRSDYVVCWAALDDADEENGCLRAIPGSHLEGLRRHEYRKSDEGHYAGVFLEEPPPRESEAVSLPVRRGDVVVMHSRLVHATFPNRSPRERRALIYGLGKPVSDRMRVVRGNTETVRPFLVMGALA